MASACQSLDDPYIEWIHWPQASIPSEMMSSSIQKILILFKTQYVVKRDPMVREARLLVLVLSTISLKEAAAYGLRLADIGEMMSREFHNIEEEPSELEIICIEARFQG
ncbi:Hypothetical predicted protein [Olea europaea subsp. europaea]|uniref:1-phosphatidylinositol 4-kinase n=1 Tax=Olea europaea subsp. europaea TaxID=158383 RepID=A0A8S0VLT7_OLEEU|nr:Hypothetical predicted protein [Olea europaea subsp. europaea]